MNIWVVYIYEAVNGVDPEVHTSWYGFLCSALARAGAEVRWFQSTFAHADRRHRFSCTTEYIADDGVRITFVDGPGYKKSGSIGRIWHNRSVASAMYEIMCRATRAPDLIIAGLPCVETVGVAAKYATEHDVPFVIDAHDMWPEIYVKMFPSAIRRLGRSLLAWEFNTARSCYRKADCFTAVSSAYLRWIQSFAGKATRLDRVFPLGYSVPDIRECEVTDRFNQLRRKHKFPESEVRAVFVGSFGRFYDVTTIVGAARIAAREFPELTFVIIGDGDRMADVKRHSVGLRNLTLTGWLDQRDAYAVLRNSDIGLSAYTRDATQSLPYKPFEYMAAGLVQICSLKGEIIEILGAARIGTVYEPGDPRSLFAALRALSTCLGTDPDSRYRARQLFESQYDMKRIYQDYADYIINLPGMLPRVGRSKPMVV